MNLQRNGLLLVVLVGLLTLMLLLAVTFTALSRMERTRTASDTDGVRAKLLARSGVEYAVARLLDNPDLVSVGQAFQPAEDDWRFRGEPGLRLEETLNPSYNQDPYRDTDGNDRYSSGDFFDDPDGNGRFDGWSGRLRGTYASHSDLLKLKIENGNSKIHINGGVLTDTDENENGVPDYRDVEVMREISGVPFPAKGDGPPGDWTEDGPNGFLVRLLNNLEQIVTGADPGSGPGAGSPTLGKVIIENRPVGGYRSLDELEPVLSVIPAKAGIQSSFDLFAPYLTLRAWVDDKVVKPQPVNSRPWRWTDIDEKFRENGSETVSVDNKWERKWWESQGETDGIHRYDIHWKQDYIYAHRQLRLGPVSLQPRAPLDLHLSAPALLAASLSGLSGIYLGVWESNLGYDSGFGFYRHVGVYDVHQTTELLGMESYTYPGRETTDSPWIRTRVKYGSEYGTADRPFYFGDKDWPHNENGREGQDGGMLPFPGPLGELCRTRPLSPRQAAGITEQVDSARSLRETVPGGSSGSGPADFILDPFRSWNSVRYWLGALPAWEDVNEDGLLDGFEGEEWYVTSNGPRKRFALEDWNGNGIPENRYFDASSTMKGLTAQQKDALFAMINPNTDLNDFNPDYNLWKWVDKTDLLEPLTEWTLRPLGMFSVESAGTLRNRTEDVKGTGRVRCDLDLYRIYTDRSQADFMRGAVGGEWKDVRLRDLEQEGAAFAKDAKKQAEETEEANEIMTSHPQLEYQWDRVKKEDLDGYRASPPPYEMAGDLVLQIYPQPVNHPSSSSLAYDGQVGLGGIGAMRAPVNERFRSDLWGEMSPAAPNRDPMDPDLHGPFFHPLAATEGKEPGGWFADGVYSERDGTPRLSFLDMLPPHYKNRLSSQYKNGSAIDLVYFSGWIKPNWFPQAATRPHTLFSMGPTQWPIGSDRWPRQVPVVSSLDPWGCYFVPARNNQQEVAVYAHSGASTRGMGWASRTLLYGYMHNFSGSATLNHHGLPYTAGSKGAVAPARLGRGEWIHLSLLTEASPGAVTNTFRLQGEPAVSLSWFPRHRATDYELFLFADHMRLGEMASAHNMNYTADATYGPAVFGLRFGGGSLDVQAKTLLESYFQASAGTGRYFKEPRSTFLHPGIPADVGKVVWAAHTEIPALEDPQIGLRPPVRIDLEVRLLTPDGEDRLLMTIPGETAPGQDRGVPSLQPPPQQPIAVPPGRVYYRAIFINEWDDVTRLNTPLNTTPFLDDVTIAYVPQGGPEVISYRED